MAREWYYFSQGLKTVAFAEKQGVVLHVIVHMKSGRWGAALSKRPLVRDVVNE